MIAAWAFKPKYEICDCVIQTAICIDYRRQVEDLYLIEMYENVLVLESNPGPLKQVAQGCAAMC